MLRCRLLSGGARGTITPLSPRRAGIRKETPGSRIRWSSRPNIRHGGEAHCREGMIAGPRKQRRNGELHYSYREDGVLSDEQLGIAVAQGIDLRAFPNLDEQEITEYIRRCCMLLACAPEEAVDIARRCPGLLSLTSHDLALGVLELKDLLPGANLPKLLRLRPSLLVMDGRKERVDHAIRQMRALMPGTSAEAKLHEGGTAYWTFVELLK